MAIIHKYIRDGRSPIPKSSVTSRVMSANRAKDTKPELLLRKELWKNNIRGYRLHTKNILGRPDIVFNKYKVAIFVNGCYWHRCPYCNLSLPKTNSEFWKDKFDRNKKRDKETELLLKNNGWNVLVIWECMIKNDILGVVRKIEKKLNKYAN